MDMGLGELQELVMDREAWHAAVHGVEKSRIWLSDWTELNWTEPRLHEKAIYELGVSPSNKASGAEAERNGSAQEK